jgi:hypothetical protein
MGEKIPKRLEMKVYICRNGFIGISQEQDMEPDPIVVSLPHKDVPQLIEMLREKVRERKTLSEGDFEDDE